MLTVIYASVTKFELDILFEMLALMVYVFTCLQVSISWKGMLIRSPKTGIFSNMGCTLVTISRTLSESLKDRFS